jgi:quinol monooxygenase YgiN
MTKIIEQSIHPFLVISGRIADHKKIEFEHTFRVGFSSISMECISKTLSEDKNDEGIYYFFSLWTSEQALKIFMESLEFQLLNGAFHALGSVGQTIRGTIYSSLS